MPIENYYSLTLGPAVFCVKGQVANVLGSKGPIAHLVTVTISQLVPVAAIDN